MKTVEKALEAVRGILEEKDRQIDELKKRLEALQGVKMQHPVCRYVIVDDNDRELPEPLQSEARYWAEKEVSGLGMPEPDWKQTTFLPDKGEGVGNEKLAYHLFHQYGRLDVYSNTVKVRLASAFTWSATPRGGLFWAAITGGGTLSGFNYACNKCGSKTEGAHYPFCPEFKAMREQG